MAEKPRRSLIKCFAKAVAGLALGVSLAYGGFIGAFYAGRGEKLTSGEQAVVRSIFGDEIDASKIRKHFKDNADITHLMKHTDGTVLPFISHIDFFGKNVASADYSQADPNLYGLFVHESTHCWQNQNWAWTAKNAGIYTYELKPESRFADFGMEQQADIIRDYAMRFLNVEGRRHASAATQDRDAMLQRVVENRFPQAQKTRMALDAQDARASAPKGPSA
jgi:hypothetical protein